MPWLRRGPTLADYAADYLVTAKPRLARSTYQARERVLRLHILPRLGRKPLEAITRHDVRHLIAGKLEAGMARPTVRHHLAILSAVLSQAVEDGLVAVNPAGGRWREYRLTARSGPPRHLTAEQLQAITAQADRAGPPWSVIVGLLWRTGLRRGEALALTWSDVDLGGRTIRVHDTLYHDRTLAGRTKSGRARLVDLSPAAVEILTRHRAWCRKAAFAAGIPRPGWVFWGPGGRPILPNTLVRRWQRWRRWAGLPRKVTIHGLRHTYAVRALEAGARSRYVQQQLGHSTIAITMELYGAGARYDDSKCLEDMEIEPRST